MPQFLSSSYLKQMIVFQFLYMSCKNIKHVEKYKTIPKLCVRYLSVSFSKPNKSFIKQAGKLSQQGLI